MSLQLAHIQNGSAMDIADMPRDDFGWLRGMILEKVAGGSHLAALFPFRHDKDTLLAAVLTATDQPGMWLGLAEIGDSFPSLTPECPQAHLFEREIAETWNIAPRGHPWLKPVRFPQPSGEARNKHLPESFGGGRGPSVMDFFQVEGEEVHEVAVGPVHAGVIEPGHFRFQCHGEEVMHLEISLGYQHRGIEKALEGGPGPRTRHLLETAAGDTTCGHALAYAMNIESLADLAVSAEADRVRGIGLELERIANHVGDLGALSGDVGFLPTASYCGRLRGDILNLTALICGNRFGRGLIVPGGVGHGIDPAMSALAAERLGAAMRDIRGAVALMFKSPSVLARFEGTGVVDRGTAIDLGLVGPAARASGLEVDVRCFHPHGPYRDTEVPLQLRMHGDVMDRASQRREEVDTSARLIEGWLGQACAAKPADAYARRQLRPDAFAVSLTEGWRGQVCHAAVTDSRGAFSAYKVVDASFHNWTGLAMALRNQQISDFPLCNKSFNLSYCGYDL